MIHCSLSPIPSINLLEGQLLSMPFMGFVGPFWGIKLLATSLSLKIEMYTFANISAVLHAWLAVMHDAAAFNQTPCPCNIHPCGQASKNGHVIASRRDVLISMTVGCSNSWMLDRYLLMVGEVVSFLVTVYLK